MTKAEAHALLDAARAGAQVSRQQIDQALLVTGDLLPLQIYARHELPSQMLAPECAPAWQPSSHLVAAAQSECVAPEYLQVGTRVVRLRNRPYTPRVQS